MSFQIMNTEAKAEVVKIGSINYYCVNICSLQYIFKTLLTLTFFSWI